MLPNRYTAGVMCLFLFIAGLTQKTQAKSVYVINDTVPSHLRAYKVDGTSLAYQTEYICVSDPCGDPGAVGIAIDESEYGGFLFVTFEYISPAPVKIEIVDAKSMQYVDAITATGASSLAGIVVDKGKRKVYAVDRYYPVGHLFVYSWDAQTRTLAPALSSPYYVQLPGCTKGFGLTLDEENGRLYVADDTNKIKYYDTSDWSKVGEVNVSCKAISIAVDVNRQLLYYGSIGYPYGQGAPNLYQYNLSSSSVQEVNVGCSVAGIAVDQNSSLVYLTTYEGSGNNNCPPPCDRLMIYDSNLVKQNWESNDIGNPAGVCVPSGNIEYKPNLLRLTKDDNIPAGNCVLPGSPITYTIAYNANGHSDNNVTIIDYLPDEVDPNDPWDPNYDAVYHTYRWDIGTLSPGDVNSVTLIVRVNNLAEPCGVLTNRCKMEGDSTYSFDEKKTPVCCWNPGVIYVDCDATGHNTGMSWRNAYRDLQKALTRAGYGCGSEIWVAAGTYEPCVPSGSPTFKLINGVSVYGHFAGNEISPNQRKLSDPASETILAGDYNVVTASNLSQDTILDGFSITGIRSACVKIQKAKLVAVKNCLITLSSSGGDGINATESSFTIADCNIHNNNYGIYADFKNNNTLPETRIENCLIRSNLQDGIFLCNVVSSPPPVVTGCKIFANGNYGITVSSAPATITNNWIYKNVSAEIYLYKPGSATIRNNTIVGNNNTDYGIYRDRGTTPIITSCIIWGNSTQLSGCSDVNYSCIQNYKCLGTTDINTNPYFADANANNFHLKPVSPCIDKGDPNFSDFDDKDIDGECRIMDGNNDGTSIVDMGADELHRTDFNFDGIVNFIDFAMFANSWATNAGEPDYNDLYDLEDDNAINIYDLALFSDDWLWVGLWSEFYQPPGIGGMDMVIGTDESLGLGEETCETAAVEEPAVSEEATAAAEQSDEGVAAPMSRERLEELIIWTEQLWQSNPEIRAMVNQADYERVLESLKSQLND